jgi:hypothetical protein
LLGAGTLGLGGLRGFFGGEEGLSLGLLASGFGFLGFGVFPIFCR